MDEECETTLVRSFFEKRIRDRFIFELCSAKKRINALNRLCHDYNEIFIKKYIIQSLKPIFDYKEVLDLLKSHNAPDDSYAISFNRDIDGKYIKLDFALQQSVSFGMPSIISCIPDRLIYFESEQEKGAPIRLILKRDQ